MMNIEFEEIIKIITDEEVHILCEKYEKTKDKKLKGFINYLYHHKRWENNKKPFQVGRWKMMCNACSLS